MMIRKDPITKTSETTAKRLPAFFYDMVPELLAEAGHNQGASEALMSLDTELFYWHRLAVKGEVPRQLIAELGIELECVQFQAITAVFRIKSGIGRTQVEAPTIGLLAEEMNLDPSRASRIATDLISRGFLERGAAQDDGRKSILLLTQKANDTFIAYRKLKWSKMIEIFADWSEEDITKFSQLFERYSQGLSRAYNAPD